MYPPAPSWAPSDWHNWHMSDSHDPGGEPDNPSDLRMGDSHDPGGELDNDTSAPQVELEIERKLKELLQIHRSKTCKLHVHWLILEALAEANDLAQDVARMEKDLQDKDKEIQTLTNTLYCGY